MQNPALLLACTVYTGEHVCSLASNHPIILMCLFIEAAQGYHNSLLSCSRPPHTTHPPPAPSAEAPSTLLFVFDPSFITHALVLFVFLLCPPFMSAPATPPCGLSSFPSLSPFLSLLPAPHPLSEVTDQGRDGPIKWRRACPIAPGFLSVSAVVITDAERFNIPENVAFSLALQNKMDQIWRLT